MVSKAGQKIYKNEGLSFMSQGQAGAEMMSGPRANKEPRRIVRIDMTAEALEVQEASTSQKVELSWDKLRVRRYVKWKIGRLCGRMTRRTGRTSVNGMRQLSSLTRRWRHCSDSRMCGPCVTAKDASTTSDRHIKLSYE